MPTIPRWMDGSPIAPRSRGPLRDAVRSAFNLVPGPVGPYRVYAANRRGMLTEIFHGHEVPLLVAVPGAMLLHHPLVPPNRLSYRIRPTAADLRGGFPFRRLAAISEIVWATRFPLYWARSGLTLMSGDHYSAAQTAFGPGRRRWSPEIARTRCGAALIDYGTTSTLLDIISRLQALEACWNVGDHDPQAWARLTGDLFLSVLQGPPSLWSGDTDPGTDDPAGEADGRTVSRDDDDDRDPNVCPHCEDGCQDCINAGECSECGRALD